MKQEITAPILFLTFNRLDTTKKVFERIKESRPAKLYFASDGPRPDKIGEREEVLKVRRFIEDSIDWECEMKTLFRDENLGCGKAVSEAITWFFENEEYGIILEDDCLPTKSFFTFCDENLLHYKDDNRVWHINGNNFNSKCYNTPYDYHFAYYAQVWGWATWRRAWNNYRYSIFELEDDEKLSKLCFKRLGWSDNNCETVFKRLKNIQQGNLDTWDFQWQYWVFVNAGLVIVPKKNQISNLGFDGQGTHSKLSLVKRAFKANIIAEEMDNEQLSHPNYILIDELMNEWYKELMIVPSLKTKLKALKKIFIGV